jgi:superfamily II DNA helicase RecQ
MVHLHKVTVISPLTLKTTALNTLRSVFGYQSFRKGQEEVIHAALSGQDALVVMATGNGKSLCYQIPALCFTGHILHAETLPYTINRRHHFLCIN